MWLDAQSLVPASGQILAAGETTGWLFMQHGQDGVEYPRSTSSSRPLPKPPFHVPFKGPSNSASRFIRLLLTPFGISRRNIRCLLIVAPAVAQLWPGCGSAVARLGRGWDPAGIRLRPFPQRKRVPWIALRNLKLWQRFEEGDECFCNEWTWNMH